MTTQPTQLNKALEGGRICDLLRNAAEELESIPPERITLFPGWADTDPSHPPESDEKLAADQGVRRAADAILNEGTLADECSYVSYRDLGCLVRYLGDLLEG